jgi:hypothetical protein
VNGTIVAAGITDFTLDCSTSGSAGQSRGHWRIDVDGTLDSRGGEGLQNARYARNSPESPMRAN